MKPTAPIARIPIAETFATVLNSRLEGFFNTCQTRLDCRMNDFNLLPSAMVILDGGVL